MGIEIVVFLVLLIAWMYGCYLLSKSPSSNRPYPYYGPTQYRQYYIPPPLTPIPDRGVYKDGKGYLRYRNSDRLVHRDVAYREIYLPNRRYYSLPFGQYHVHHKDRNKLNNDPNNLLIVTEQDHLALHGRKDWN